MIDFVAHHLPLFFIILAAYFIRGVTGFGSGLIAVPLLAFSHSLQVAVPLILTLDFIASFLLGSVGGNKADWREIRLLLPFGLIGAAFGVFALIHFPSNPVLIALALFVIFFGMRNVLGIQHEGRTRRSGRFPPA